jgi:hypothetical protein
VPDFWAHVVTAFFAIPVFMADSLSAYFHGRLYYEELKGWKDIQVTPEGKKLALRHSPFWRMLSLAAAACLAIFLFHGFTGSPAYWRWFFTPFVLLFTIHALHAQWFIFQHIGPLVPAFTSRAHLSRTLGLALFSALWLIWLGFRGPEPFTKWAILFHGGLYFFLNSFLHPVPSKFSVFRLTDPVRSKAPAIAGPLPAAKLGYIRDTAITREAELWRGIGFSRELGLFHMPLLELPLFEAVGEAFTTDQGEHLAMIVKTEVRTFRHRCLISRNAHTWFITTDFGAPDAKFPQSVVYRNYPLETPTAQLLQAHVDMAGADLLPFAADPWLSLNELLDTIRAFLQQPPTPSEHRKTAEKVE